MSDPITALEKEAATDRDSLEASNINSNYAFLVHSQTTIPGNLPPNVDNKALARQKRRRTSPEDHAILETEYQRNPKPDKAARVDIIWFQNRRQNDRRKSRPLHPHEVFSPFRAYSYIPPTESDVSASKSQENSGDGNFPPSESSEAVPAIQPQSTTPDSSFQSTDESFADQEMKRETAVDATGEAIQIIAVREERPISMRLSMSLDGNAQVTPNTDFQISPPKYRQNPAVFSLGRVGGLKRSQSAVTLGETGPSAISRLFSDFSKRSSLGRSRDSRTWEFYCDSDARDALTTQAERENSGSAAGAISLMRSRSNTAIQKSNNRALQKPKLETMTDKNFSSQYRRKSKFSRATSSLGRLQSNKGNIKPKDSSAVAKTSKLGKQEKLQTLGSPTGDSDKENWIPGIQASNTPRRQDPKGRPAKKQILNENRQILSQSSGLEAYLAEDKRWASRKQHELSKEDKENEVVGDKDKEVESFIRGGPRGGEDFDCVQGLLSLSQGAWR